MLAQGVVGDWLGPLLASPRCLPFSGEHGGYFLVQCDLSPRLWDLHAAFSPQGWGREAHAVLQGVMVYPAWDLITVTEVSGLPTSRPPLSFGFRPAGEMRDHRTWVLTRTAWEASPAYRRMEKRCRP